ncbi:MarR family winged helix-turn-helix transcriptional regulator [Actinophytocola sp. KF-1]
MRGVEAYRLLIADVYELAGLSRRTSEELARSLGQTAARWHVLSVVSDGPRTVPSAARRLGLAPQSVQRVVGDLVDAGLLEAVDNPDHARSPLLRLTGEGRAVVDELFARSRDNRADVLARAGVTADELLAAREVVRKLAAALRA